MKIMVNKDKGITSIVQDILLVILLTMCIFFAYDNSTLREESEEIKHRYNIVQEEKMKLLEKIKWE